MKKSSIWMAGLTLGLYGIVGAPAWAQDLDEARVREIVREEAGKKPLLEVNGYFRAGYGLSSKGAAMEAFGMPDNLGWQGTKFRLGNETDVYGDLAITANWYNPNGESGKMFRSVMRLNYKNDMHAVDSFAFGMPEIYGESVNVFQQGLRLWAGKRYRRMDVHIIDYYHLDYSGFGGGFDDLDLGFMKVSLAMIGSGAARGSAGPTGSGSEGYGPLAKTTLDLHLTNINTIGIGGTSEFWIAGAYQNGLRKDQDIPGFSVAYLHNREIRPGSFNRFAAQYGLGSLASLSPNFVAGLASGPVPPSDPSEFTTEKAWRLVIMDYFMSQFSENFSVMFVADFEYGESGAPNNPSILTFSIGARPIYHFTQELSLAVEGGFQYMEKAYSAQKGMLGKLTLAPQVAAQEGFWGRPVLRAFATAAMWSDDLKGAVGGRSFANDTFGMSFGLQVETWW